MLKGIEYKILLNESNCSINDIQYDSRKIKKNDCFIAMKGTNLDGNDYISNAIENGACLILTDNEKIDISKYFGISIYYVKNLRENLGLIASNFYDHPQDKLIILGVTGTNGKTTSTYIIENIVGINNSSRIGTNNYRIKDKIYKSNNTTPESLDLIKLMRQSVDQNVKYFIMEVSSHALCMGRVNSIEFSGAIFTNLTQDHLDYHKTMDEYFKAKCLIINKLKKDAYICLNTDDEYIKKINARSISFGLNNQDINAKLLSYENNKMRIQIQYNNISKIIDTNLIGKHNLYNILGCVALCTSIGIDFEYILDKISIMDSVDGRFESIKNDLAAKIVIDYAHTPDGLENVLKTLKEITDNKLYCLFGCGGDRDKTKRDKMGKIASVYADYCILTSDNPRTENPMDILEDIKLGVVNDQYTIIEDRKKAIHYAISLLKNGDSLIIAGKGHEDYQIIGVEKKYFSDKKVVVDYLQNK